MFACFEPVMSTLVRGFANLIWRRYQGIDSYSRIGTFFLLLLGASGPQLGRVWEQAGDQLLVGAVDIVRKKFTCSFLVTLFYLPIVILYSIMSFKSHDVAVLDALLRAIGLAVVTYLVGYLFGFAMKEIFVETKGKI